MMVSDLLLTVGFGASIGVINSRPWGGWLKLAGFVVATVAYLAVMGRIEP